MQPKNEIKPNVMEELIVKTGCIYTYTFILVAEKQGEISCVFSTAPFPEKLAFFYTIKIELINITPQEKNVTKEKL